MELNQLASLGLSQPQIKRILERIPKESVHLFIKQWIAEKGVSSQQTQPQSDIRRTGEYSARRKNHSVEPSYSRDMDFVKDSTVKTPYMPRMLPNFTDRGTSEEMQKKYQDKTNSRNNPSANLDIMSSQLFGKPPEEGYNEIFLHKKYKQLAVALHPDRQNGDGTAFKMLTTCYNHLKQSIPSGMTNINVGERSSIRENISVPPPDSLFDSKFDASVFNEYYTNNAFKDKDIGYGDWLKSESTIKQPERPSESNFHSAYEKNKRAHTNNMDESRYQLMKCPDIPEELVSNVNAALLGEEEVNDYSGETVSGTKYTDIRRALEAPHLTYEDSTVNEEDISKSFARVKNNRGSIPEHMTDEDKRRYVELGQKKKEDEEYRLYRLRQRDEDIAAHFKTTHHNRLEM
jgi:hypothetical protein